MANGVDTMGFEPCSILPLTQRFQVGEGFWP